MCIRDRSSAGVCTYVPHGMARPPLFVTQCRDDVSSALSTLGGNLGGKPMPEGSCNDPGLQLAGLAELQ
eukprot:4690520-Alexandrium_andersonii.AAC.1